MTQSRYSSDLKEKQLLREKIQSDIDEYLAKGGKIKWYPPEHHKEGVKIDSMKVKRRKSRSFSQPTLRRIDLMRKNGMSYQKIAEKMNSSASTVQRQYKDWLWDGGRAFNP